MKSTSQSSRKYYVDEAGDGTLFSAKGRVIIGEAGCSRYFLLGVLDVRDTGALEQSLNHLRTELLADPYFSKVPSMQPDARKTYNCFHAKDDLPEIRREVFRLLREHELKFQAVVRRKIKVLEYVRQRNQRNDGYRYHPNELYDYMVRCLFKQMLHKDDGYLVTFAKRGGSDRSAALRLALQSARDRFCRRRGIKRTAAIQVIAGTPSSCSALQAVDYFLWALQRCYEKGDDRYVEYLWPAFSLLWDIDDTRDHRYGRYYARTKPLRKEYLDLPGI